MNLIKLLLVNILVVVCIPSASAEQSVTKSSGGSIRTELGYGIVINKESSLTREWITIHDSALPVDISGTVGVKTIYESGERYSRGNYQYSAEYTITTTEAISAIEVRFLTFDIWGNHARNLSATKIIDLGAGSTKMFDGKWNGYSENEE